MEKNTGLLLEGGAMRSMFSAGVLDRLLEAGIHIPNVMAVSAGAYAGMNYVTEQKGRAIDAVIKPLEEYRFLGFRTFLRKGTFFDMDYLFREVPKTKAHYDFAKLQAFEGRFLTSTVNCSTGETVYYEKFEDEDSFFTICKAANSLPLIARISSIGGEPMMDGGVADAIPIDKVLEEGWKKVVVVLTQELSYRKKPYSRLYMLVIRLLYGKYPKLVELMAKREIHYNESLDEVERLEQEGKAFVLRPEGVKLKNNESRVTVLLDYYRAGYEEADRRLPELERFLG